MYLRVNREARIVGVCIAASAWSLFYQHTHHLDPWWLGAAACGLLAARSIPMAAVLMRRRARLAEGTAVQKLSSETLERWVQQHPADIYLGDGFEWTNTVARRAYELMVQDRPEDGQTARWIHGVGDPGEVRLPLRLAAGHTLIVGTTGAGKTRMLDLLMAQGAMRNEAVVVIDPKGDQDLCNKLRDLLTRRGEADRFVYFHTAWPDKSVRIDPLKNWNRPTELSSRIAALVPSETGADPFTAFDWKVLTDIIYGLVLIEQRPTLKRLRQHLENPPDQLVASALKRYFAATVEDWENRLRAYLSRSKNDETSACVQFYRTEIAGTKGGKVEIDGLLSMWEHNREHFAKMTASLIPILSMLTTGALGDLLSPDSSANDPRPITDMRRIIDRGQVAYIGLDSMSDNKVASALGAIMLADLTAVAGDRYNYADPTKIRPVNLCVDEINEVLNGPFIQVLNKGRGAMIRVVAATQALADLEVRTGSKAVAQQVLGNFNNMIAMRTFGDTQKYLASQLPRTTVEQKAHSHSMSAGTGDPLTGHASSMSESRSERETERFPPALFGVLPDFEYIARLGSGQVIKGKIPVITHPEPGRKQIGFLQRIFARIRFTTT